MATPDNLVKLGQLQTSLQRVKTELDALDGRNFGGVTIANHKLNLFATSDTTNPTLTYSFINLEKLVDTSAD